MGLGQTHIQTHRHTDTHIYTMTRPGLGAGPSEKCVEFETRFEHFTEVKGWDCKRLDEHSLVYVQSLCFLIAKKLNLISGGATTFLYLYLLLNQINKIIEVPGKFLRHLLLCQIYILISILVNASHVNIWLLSDRWYLFKKVCVVFASNAHTKRFFLNIGHNNHQFVGVSFDSFWQSYVYLALK